MPGAPARGRRDRGLAAPAGGGTHPHLERGQTRLGPGAFCLQAAAEAGVDSQAAWVSRAEFKPGRGGVCWRTVAPPCLRQASAAESTITMPMTDAAHSRVRAMGMPLA